MQGDTLYFILIKLSLNDLRNMSMLNKYYYEIIKKDKLWKLKLIHDFPKLLGTKPDNLNFHVWYMTIVYSGDLYIYTKLTKEAKFVASYVKKSVIIMNDAILYIDIYGKLYFYGNPNIADDLILDKKYIDILNLHKNNILVNLELNSHVKDIYIGSNKYNYCSLLHNIRNILFDEEYIYLLSIENNLYRHNQI